mmetsp:Transcript_10668/g.30333  ORF Transcript_10668/g.30333 Transcript_10668/m.30333 type:complete len:209 (+) Transcript_10668:1107-1733(+)
MVPKFEVRRRGRWSPPAPGKPVDGHAAAALQCQADPVKAVGGWRVPLELLPLVAPAQDGLEVSVCPLQQLAVPQQNVVVELRVDAVQRRTRPRGGDVDKLLKGVGGCHLLQHSLVSRLCETDIVSVHDSDGGTVPDVLLEAAGDATVEPDHRIVGVDLIALVVQKEAATVANDRAGLELPSAADVVLREQLEQLAPRVAAGVVPVLGV